MNKFCLTLLVIPTLMFSEQPNDQVNQETDQKIEEQKQPHLEWGGYFRLDTALDTRQCVGTDDNVCVVYPKKYEPDSNCCDINDKGQFVMTPAVSRIWLKAVGPTIGRADLSGYLEMDFLGRDYLSLGITLGLPRLRYAYAKIKWPDTNILIGQFLHPLTPVPMIPNTVGYFAGIPIEVYARTPQITFTYQPNHLALIGTVYSQYMDTDTGPRGAKIDYIQDSMTPGLYVGVEWRGERALFGAGIDMHRIMPALSVTPTTTTIDKTYATNEKLTSFIGTIYANIQPTENVVLKSTFTIGQNGFSVLSIGGYAVNCLDSTTGLRTYTNINFANLWLDIDYTRYQQIVPGMFIGIAKCLGSYNKCVYIGSDNKPIFYGLDSELESVFRVAPRIHGYIDKFEIGFELDYSKAWFGPMNCRGKHPCTYSKNNVRVLLTTMYKF